MINHKGILYAGAAALMWGFLAIFLKVALNYASPMTIVWLRFTIAFSLLAAILYLKDRESLKILTNPPVLALVAALGLAFNYIGYVTGLSLTTPSNAQVIIQIAPLLLSLVGVIIYRERLTKWQIVGFLFAVSGFIMFYQDQISNLLSSPADYRTGIFWVIGAALAWVVYAAVQKRLVTHHKPQSLNLVIYLLPSLLLWPGADFTSIVNFSWKIWLLIGFLGLNTLLAYGAIAEAFKVLDTNKVGIIVTINPLITIAAMAILAGFDVDWIQPERISTMGILGALLILTGVMIAITSSSVRSKPASKKFPASRVIVNLKE